MAALGDGNFRTDEQRGTAHSARAAFGPAAALQRRSLSPGWCVERCDARCGDEPGRTCHCAIGGRAPIGQEQIFASGATTENLAHSQRPQPGTDPPPVRRSRILPDSATGPETGGERLYHEVFAPAVYPYKRMSVLDGVDDDGAMKLRRSDLVAVPVEKPGPHRVEIHFMDRWSSILSPAKLCRCQRRLPVSDSVVSIDADPQSVVFRRWAENLYVRRRPGPPSLGLFDGCRARYFAGPLLPPGHQRRCSAMCPTI